MCVSVFSIVCVCVRARACEHGMMSQEVSECD